MTSMNSTICRKLISSLKKIPNMLNDADIRLNLLTDFEDDEKSLLLGKRSSDPLVDLQDIVEFAFRLGKPDILIENAKARPQSQTNKEELNKIEQEIRRSLVSPLSQTNTHSIENISIQDEDLSLSSQQEKHLKSPGFEHGYALLIGVGADLPVTVKDATGLKDILVDPERCAYPDGNIKLLTEKQATRQGILGGLDWLKTKIQGDPAATVIVYFSGHGWYLPNYHLVPFGYNDEDLINTAVSGAEFTEKLRAIHSKKLLVLLDCCRAGGIVEVKKPGFKKAPMPPELSQILTKGSGRVVLASSRGDENSLTGTPYSLFTQALREGLAGYGAAEQDGYAYIADVAMYVGRVVPNRASERQHPQHPILKLAAADNFALAYYAGGDKSPKPLPEAQTSIPSLETIDADLFKGYRNILKKLQQNLLTVEEQMAEFFDYANIHPDLKRAKEGLLKRIADVELEIEKQTKE